MKAKAREVWRVRWAWDQAEGVTFQHDDECEECARARADWVAWQPGRRLLGGVERVTVREARR